MGSEYIEARDDNIELSSSVLAITEHQMMMKKCDTEDDHYPAVYAPKPPSLDYTSDQSSCRLFLCNMNVISFENLSEFHLLPSKLNDDTISAIDQTPMYILPPPPPSFISSSSFSLLYDEIINGGEILTMVMI